MSSAASLQARSVDQLIWAMNAGEQPKFTFFWGHTPRPDGELSAACFSQWWASRFHVDDQSFATAEHYMMWRKALLFNDQASAAAVLAAESPGKAKAIGRTVAGFKEEIWVQHRWEIVVSGSIAKFTSTEQLRLYLLATQNRVLVEASPRDRIWGIGLSKDSPDATVPSRWQGLNLLGFALMEAREQISAM